MYKDYWMIPVGLLMAVGVIAFIFWSVPMHGIQRIDCRIAEISPDIPVEAKELCRKARSGRI